MAVTTVWDTLDKDAQDYIGGNYHNIAALFQAMPEPTDSDSKVAGNKLKQGLILAQIGDTRIPNPDFMNKLNNGLASDTTQREIVELSEKNGKALNGVMDRVVASPANTGAIIDGAYRQAFPAAAANMPQHAPAAPPAQQSNASPAPAAPNTPPPSGDTQPSSNGASNTSGVTPVDLAATSLAPGDAAAGLASAIAAIIAMIKFLPGILNALTKDGGLANLAGNSDFKGLINAFSTLMGAAGVTMAPDAAPTKPSVPMDQADAKDPNAASAPNRRSLNALSQPPLAAPTAAPATQPSGTQNVAQNNIPAKPGINTTGLSAPN